MRKFNNLILLQKNKGRLVILAYLKMLPSSADSCYVKKYNDFVIRLPLSSTLKDEIEKARIHEKNIVIFHSVSYSQPFRSATKHMFSKYQKAIVINQNNLIEAPDGVYIVKIPIKTPQS